MPHAVADQLGQLFPLRASVEVEALLSDALGVVLARVPGHSLPPHAFLTQTPCPLHALLPQQRVLRLVTRGGVSVGRLLLPGLSALATLHALLYVDGHLRLGGQGRGVNCCIIIPSCKMQTFTPLMPF